jgi:hypothetical protein
MRHIASKTREHNPATFKSTLLTIVISRDGYIVRDAEQEMPSSLHELDPNRRVTAPMTAP